MSSIAKDIKKNFKLGNSLTKLIYINVGVFLLVKILYVFSFLFSIPLIAITDYFSLPASFYVLAKKPWSIISYMFLHQSFIHLLFNMLWLYFGGQIFLSFLFFLLIFFRFLLLLCQMPWLLDLPPQYLPLLWQLPPNHLTILSVCYLLEI